MNAQPTRLSPARLLGDLTDAQRQAVTHGPGPLVIVAGPGAGKTRTLTRRVGWLLESGAVLASELVAVTFTVKAAAEMRVRLADLLGADAVRDLHVGTFHSLCARILREQAGAFGRNEGYSVWDDEDQKDAATRALRQLGGNDLGELLTEHGLLVRGERPQVRAMATRMLREISLARNTCVTREHYREHGRHPARQLIAALWELYELELQASNAFDFDQLLTCTASLLASSETVRALYRARWPWVLVDEFQDTNPAQMAVVKALCAPLGNLTVCGDDDQAIYSFRGTEIRNLLDFEGAFRAVTPVVLGRNFRSRAEIVEASARCVEHNTLRRPKRLIADRGCGASVVAAGFPDDDAEADWISDEIARQFDAGIPPSEVLVLFRSRYLSKTLEKKLRARRMPYRIIGDIAFWQRSVVKDAFAYLGLLANPYDVQAFRRALASPTRNIGDIRSQQLIEFAVTQHEGDLVAALEQAGQLQDLPRQARAAAALMGEGLRKVQANQWARYERKEQHVGRAVVETMMIPGGLVDDLQRRKAKAPMTRKAADAEAQLEELRSLGEVAYSYERTDPDGASLMGFCDHLLAFDVEEVEGGTDPRVTLATIHRAKGAEAACVFVVGCEEGALPGRRAMEDHGDAGLQEERRCWYVAATRAKNTLAFTHCTRRQRRFTDGPSRFLREAALA